MPSICFYFQVHQPHRLRKLSYFDIGQKHSYFDEETNRAIVRKVAEKCYLPTNAILLDLIKKNAGEFKVAFSISGTAIEQFKQFCPDVLYSFKALVDTGQVELLNETYHHSLSAIFSENTFKHEVNMHHDLILTEFGYDATTFRNTELIFNNQLATWVANLGYKTILAEGADKILLHRSPNYLYQTLAEKSQQSLVMLLKNYRLSDDIAFRFSNQQWSEFPLMADKFAQWIHQTEQDAEVINLFMDYETFGEHQWQSTGIFEFLKHLPGEIFTKTGFDFCLPHEAQHRYQCREQLNIPEFYSWADTERDLSAWLGNDLQKDALQTIYSLEQQVKKSENSHLLNTWHALLTSDHFYYMFTKQGEDGDVHKYFSPYGNAYDAYVNYQNIVRDFKGRLV